MKSENRNTYEEEVGRARIKVGRCQSHAEEIFGNPYPSQRNVRETPGKSAMVSRRTGIITQGLKAGVESWRDYVDFMIIGRGNCYVEQVEQGVPTASKSKVRHLSSVPSTEPITLSLGIMAQERHTNSISRPIAQLVLVIPASSTDGN